MQLLCPACQTPLAAPAGQVAVACGACALEVDLSRLHTVAGKPRFLPERDRTGSTVDGHRIEARLGSGGMGHVYRAARDGDTGPEPCALKFLASALAADPEPRGRFLREVKVLRGLDHPAIVRVLASGEVDGIPWFAMTLVPGPSLRSRLLQGPLSPDETRAIFGRVLAALEHAHQQGVIHRDLKPANVLLGPGGAVLADFGIAHPGEIAAAPLTRLTETAAVLGTLPYMSPEQRAGAALDRRSDLFSAGVMLYEALTGALPQGAFPPPSKLRPSLPARLDRVILRLLQPRPSDRFPTAAEAGRALDGALAPRGRARVAVSAAAAAATLVLASVGGWFGLHRPPAVSKAAATITAKVPAATTTAKAPAAASPVEQKTAAPPVAAPPAQADPPKIDPKQLRLSPKSGKPMPARKGSVADDLARGKQRKSGQQKVQPSDPPIKSGFSPNSRPKR
jgi:serine/threonine protein kinase